MNEGIAIVSERFTLAVYQYFPMFTVVQNRETKMLELCTSHHLLQALDVPDKLSELLVQANKIIEATMKE